MNFLKQSFNKESQRTLVFAATYNERENIKDLLSDIWRIAPDTDVLIVDDNSPDGTGALLDEIAGATPFLKVIHRPGKLGLGTAHHLAMIFAMKHGYDTLVTMDADRRGWIVKGTEPSRWAAEYATSTFGLHVIHDSLEKAALSSERDCENRDVVVSWDTIEHVGNPRQYLNIVSGMLKPGGIFALSTIDIESWFSSLLGKRWPWIMEMHLFYFDTGSLERLLEETGFEVVRVEPYRHYTSLRYAYRKLCAVYPERMDKI